jgi:hypothetical protein
MAAITYDGTPYETKAKVELPTKQQLESRNKYSREEEFRSALDSYMADYQKYHATIANKRGQIHTAHFAFFKRFADWIGG